MNKVSNKQALEEWEDFLAAIRYSTSIDADETEEQKKARMQKLEAPGNHEEWFKYYFPKYCFCEPADFHKKSTVDVLANKRIYQTRAWARGLSKSTRRMFEVFYKKFVHKMQLNMLLISKTETNAVRLLAPYRGNLEANHRLINDYGTQVRPGKWKEEEFITKEKDSFRAVGMEQNPRGAKLEELRINILVFDDADDDEVIRNEDRLNAQWLWIEQAVLPTVDIAADYCIFFDNNIIGEDSIAIRAAAKATHPEVVNIRDDNGRSTWPQKNSEHDIDDFLALISYESQQKEYFNNPISQGKTFPDVKFGKCPPLRKLKLIIIYADPATSNKDKPTLKSKANNSCKVVAIVGYHDFNFYVYKAYDDNMSNSNFIDCLYNAVDYVRQQTIIKAYIENNSLQDPFYEQVLKPLIRSRARELRKSPLSIMPDARDKGDKWMRIEASLEPLNRNGQLIFNIDEKEDPHMKRMVAQFKGAKATSRVLDGPDAVEGAIFILKQNVALMLSGKQIEKVEVYESDKKY